MACLVLYAQTIRKRKKIPGEEINQKENRLLKNCLRMRAMEGLFQQTERQARYFSYFTLIKSFDNIVADPLLISHRSFFISLVMIAFPG